MDVPLLEGIALEAWESTGEMRPVEALEFARRCGIELIPWMRSYGKRSGSRLWYPASLRTRHVRQQGVVRHETGHFLAEDHGLDPHDEEAARYLSGALGLPRRPFLRDCESMDLDLFALQEVHTHVSAEAIVARMTQVLPATAWVYDNARLARHYGIEGDPAEVADLVDRALALEVPVADGNARAWPVLDGVHRRVLVVMRAA